MGEHADGRTRTGAHEAEVDWPLIFTNSETGRTYVKFDLPDGAIVQRQGDRLVRIDPGAADDLLLLRNALDALADTSPVLPIPGDKEDSG